MKKIVFLILGCACSLLGVAGVLMPVLPGIIFFVAAAFFFSHSSETLHQALRRLPYIGKSIERWELTKTMGKDIKLAVILWFLGMAIYPYFLNENKAYAIIMTMFFLITVFSVAAVTPADPSSED